MKKNLAAPATMAAAPALDLTRKACSVGISYTRGMARPERKRNRLSGYDYSTDGLYFVTSCVQDKVHAFGEVAAGVMQLNRYGQLAEQQWYWLQERFQNVVLHEFVVMPNHIHGIIQLDTPVSGGMAGHPDPVPAPTVRQEQEIYASATPGNKSISGIMGAYKTTTSKLIRQAGLPEFAWQRSFHDHIIRSSARYKHIAAYILDNPSRWPEDKFYT